MNTLCFRLFFLLISLTSFCGRRQSWSSYWKRLFGRLRRSKKKQKWGRCPKCASPLVIEQMELCSGLSDPSMLSVGPSQSQHSETQAVNDEHKLPEILRVKANESSLFSFRSRDTLRHTSLRSAEQDSQFNGSTANGQIVSTCGQIGLLTLPVEILFTIVLHVPHDGTLVALKSTCSFLHRLLDDERVWRSGRLCVQVDIRWRLVDRVLMSSPNLTSVDFSNCKAVTDHLITTVVAVHGEVRHVNVSGCVLITDVSLSHLQLALTALEHLDISRCCLVTCSGIYGLLRKHSRSLNYLNMSECLGMAYDPYKISRMAEYCTNIKHLIVGWSRQSVGLNPILDNDLIKFAIFCPNLLSLDVSCGRLSDSAVEAIAQNCEQLRYLVLAHSFIKDSGLAILAHHLGKLQVLDLGECSYITDKGLQTVGTMLPALRSLNVSHCFNITDKGINLLLMNLTQLRELRMAGCFRITDRSMKDACLQCRRLHYLDLCSTMVSAKTLQHLVYSASVCLTIVADNCPFVQYKNLAQELLIDTTEWPPCIVETPRQWMESSV